MPTFIYRARNTKTNKIERDIIKAESESAAAKLLISQGLVPQEIKEGAEKGAGKTFAGFLNHIAPKEKVVFTRQLATMLNAGLPLAQSLATIQEQTTNKALRLVIADLVNSINGGSSLSAAMSNHPKVFNTVYIALVRSGEASGALDSSLLRLANQQEHDSDQLSKIRGAMVYPAIVLSVIIGVVVFMLIALIPQVSSMYDQMGKQLPTSTGILLAITGFITNFWYIAIAAIVGVVYLIMMWLKSKAGRRAWDTAKLNMPMFSSLMRRMYMARFSRMAQVLLESGVAMIETLKISADAVNNVVIRDELLRVAAEVGNGKALSDSLKSSKYILEFVPQMVKIGETSGGIDSMLGKVADYYDKEVDSAIAGISTMIEPLLMICMAGMIGFIVLAVLLPIYSLSSTGI